MTDYLSKPLNPIELVDRIDTWLKELGSPTLAATDASPHEAGDAVEPERSASADPNGGSVPALNVDALWGAVAEMRRLRNA